MAEPGASDLTSLPILRGRLIGRETELATARSFLLDDAVPLLTLIGPGGVGKTRLALTVARDVAGSFADGVVWVDLAPLTDDGLLAATIAAAVDLVPRPDMPLAEQLIRVLRPRQTLLLLDNCEHLLAATAPLVARWLAACPALQVLATSRAPLQVRDEHLLTVEPLPVLAAGSSSPPEIARNPAVMLFAERARAAWPRFTLDEQTAGEVATICRYLDGLPLAIELAAARLKLFTLDALRDQMTDHLRLLRGGARDLPPRQQTIRDTIAWSHDLLGPEDQHVFRQLAVFSGGWTIDAAAAVTGKPIDNVIERLENLVDQSLVRRLESSTEPRFGMLETVRQFGWDQLTNFGELEPIRDRHADYFERLVLRAEPDLAIGRIASGWFARLDEERDNLRSALGWSITRLDARRAMTIAGALSEYWCFRGDFAEGRSWCDRALAISTDHTLGAARCAALYGLAAISGFQGDHAAGVAAGRRCYASPNRDGTTENKPRTSMWCGPTLPSVSSRVARAILPPSVIMPNLPLPSRARSTP